MSTPKQSETRAESAARRVGAALGKITARVDKLTGRAAKLKAAAEKQARASRRTKPRIHVAEERRAANARTEPINRRMLSEQIHARDAAAQKRRRPKARMG